MIKEFSISTTGGTELIDITSKVAGVVVNQGLGSRFKPSLLICVLVKDQIRGFRVRSQ